MIKYISLIVIPLLLAGCSYTTKPDQDRGFAAVTSLSDFDGCYENCSSTDVYDRTCLSWKIWPDKFIEADMPDAVLVKASDTHELTVSAYRQGHEVLRSTFKEGEHFVFKDGHIELEREYIGSGASEAGNVFIGLATTKSVLGVDANGEGRVDDSFSAAGTAFLVIPLAISGSDIRKIKRKGASCNEH